MGSLKQQQGLEPCGKGKRWALSSILGGVHSCSCMFGNGGAPLDTCCCRFSFVHVLRSLTALAAFACRRQSQLMLGALSSYLILPTPYLAAVLSRVPHHISQFSVLALIEEKNLSWLFFTVTPFCPGRDTGPECVKILKHLSPIDYTGHLNTPMALGITP